MKKAFAHLKKRVPLIICIILLLVIQARCDLALPDYISSIVNVGIQQNGIDRSVPEEIRVSRLETLGLLMNDDDYETVLSCYTEEQRDGEAVYKLTAPADDTLEDLLQLPILMLYAFENADAAASFGASTGTDLPEGTDIFTVLSSMTSEQRSAMLQETRDQFEEYTDIGQSAVSQITIEFVKEEYWALGIDLKDMQTDYILFTGFKMLGVALAAATSAVLVTLSAARVAAAFSRDLRRHLFHSVVRFGGGELGKFSTASLITRSTNDTQQVQQSMVMFLRIAIYAPILGIGALFKVMGSESSMGWVIGLAVGLIFLLVVVLAAIALPKFNRLQQLIDRLNQVLRETLTGLPVIRAFSREEYEQERFGVANNSLMRTQLFVFRVMAFMMPVMMLVMNLVSLLIIWVGASEIDGGTMQVGNLMAFIQYTMQIIAAFLMLSVMSIMLPRALISLGRIGEVLGTEPSVQNPATLKEFPAGKGQVEFRDVNFRYPGAEGDCLHNISFTAEPGQTTAIIGSTGSGKSTLINLIPRFFDVTDGEILVNGMDIREAGLKDLRNRLGYIPQRAILFSGTVESNIGYGDTSPDDTQIRKAAEVAQAASFITERPDGYESNISQGGSNVSGGQRQRLSIARAVAKNPEIYIFDDSFSALDYKTDIKLRKALKEETAGSTMIIVAQRISTVLNAEKILVMDEGRIVAQGTHKELLETCEVYQEIALSQLSREEME